MKQFNFQVNLEGMIDILSNHLYSEEKVFIRELLQNATDAITARAAIEPDHQGQIQIDLIPGDENAPPQIVFEDNGIGLNKEEVHQFLSSIGSSSKRKSRDLSNTREHFIGQFGIGLLSCFMITDEIVMVTRSAKGTETLEWRGNSNGSYGIRSLNIDISPGTKVYLRAKEGVDQFFKKNKLVELIRHYGNLLPFPITFGEHKERINDGRVPFESAYFSKPEMIQFGKEQFDMDFFDAFPIHADDGNTKGVAFVLPFSPNPSVKMTHKVYLKKMLISEKVDNILPKWAFFVKCIINSSNLRPTASRESFYEDDNLKKTQEELAVGIKNYLFGLAFDNVQKLQKLIRIHNDSIKALALHDDDFFKIIIPHLPFPSNIGPITLEEFEKESPEVKHIADLDEFRQVSSIAAAQGIAVINSAYIYDADLLKKYGNLYPDKVVKRVTTEHFIQQFEELTVEERNSVFDFIQEANEILQEFNCDAEIKKFRPENVPTLYHMDQKLNFIRSVQKSKDTGDALWGDILESVTEELKYKAGAQLCFNYHHPLIKQLISSQKKDIIELYIRILYVQALLLGHHPLNNKELNILNQGLMNLLELSIKVD